MKKTYKVVGWLFTVIAILTVIYRFYDSNDTTIDDADDEESEHHGNETATGKFNRKYGKCFSRHYN